LSSLHRFWLPRHAVPSWKGRTGGYEGCGQKNIYKDRILCLLPDVFEGDRQDNLSNTTTEDVMKRTLIRYKAKPELADKNAELIAEVFTELQAAKPEGIRYLSLRLDDGTFIHFVETATEDGSSALTKLAAFQAFQSGVRERCAEPPQFQTATVVGNYRMLGEP
jgi:hypothetical protein